MSLEATTLVAGESHDALLDVSEVYVPEFDLELLGDSDALGALLAELRGRFGADRDVVLRIPAGVAVPRRAGLRREVVYIAKRPRPPAEGSAGVEVRPATARDVDFVHGLLAEALVAGYRACRGCELDRQRVLAHVREHFASLTSSGPIAAAVALDGGTRVGHVTWLPESTDELTGESFVEICDSFVLESHQGRGVNAALVAFVEREAASAGRRLLGNVIVGLHDEGLVLRRLCQQGWEPQYAFWRHSVAVADQTSPTNP